MQGLPWRQSSGSVLQIHAGENCCAAGGGVFPLWIPAACCERVKHHRKARIMGRTIGRHDDSRLLDSPRRAAQSPVVHRRREFLLLRLSQSSTAQPDHSLRGRGLLLVLAAAHHVFLKRIPCPRCKNGMGLATTRPANRRLIGKPVHCRSCGVASTSRCCQTAIEPQQQRDDRATRQRETDRGIGRHAFELCNDRRHGRQPMTMANCRTTPEATVAATASAAWASLTDNIS